MNKNTIKTHWKTRNAAINQIPEDSFKKCENKGRHVKEQLNILRTEWNDAADY